MIWAIETAADRQGTPSQIEWPAAFCIAHAWVAWHDRTVGAAGQGEEGASSDVPHVQYTLAEIKRHLRTFADRFFRLSQYKRSVAPNSAKVGSGGSLSPRGDWRAPSDAESAVWLAEVERIPEA